MLPVAARGPRAGRPRDPRPRERADRSGDGRRGRARCRERRHVLVPLRGTIERAVARRAGRGDRSRTRHGSVRRQRHGIRQRPGQAPGDRVRDAGRPPGRTGDLPVAQRLGLRGARVQRPGDRVRPARVERPRGRHDGGRVPVVRAGTRVHARGRPPAGDRSEPGRLPGGARPRRRTRGAGGGTHGRAHGCVEGDGDRALGRARRRARRVRGGLRRVRRARGPVAR